MKGVTMPGITLTDEQAEALKLIQSGRNVHISGEGGTGKSALLSYYIQHLSEKEYKHTMILAPTGIAALNVGGVTIHRAFGLRPSIYGPDTPIKKYTRAKLSGVERIIIDEISMVRFDLFDYISRCIWNAGKKNIQLIVVGDFYQLPPVVTDRDREALEDLWGEPVKEGYAFQAPAWKAWNFADAHLTSVVRQAGDMNYIRMLDCLRSGQRLDECAWWCNRTMRTPKDESAISMYATNRAAEADNDKHVAELLKTHRAVNFRAAVEGSVSPSERPTSDELTMCTDMRVMALVNDGDDMYQNGSLGTVTAVHENYVMVLFDGSSCPCKVEPYEWDIKEYKLGFDGGFPSVEEKVIGSFRQLPLKVAYAITIHKSQGKTFEAANLDPYCFAEGQLYVALSRVKNHHNLHLLRPAKESFAISSPLVSEFYDKGELNTIGVERSVAAM